jgi:hypothetical protein
MKKSFWLGVAAYLLPTFPLGYFWHLKTFAGVYESLHIFRDQVIIPFGLTSMAIQAVLFSLTYPRLFDTSRDKWLRGALGFGAFAALLSWSFTTLPVAAKYQMTSPGTFMAIETAYTCVNFLVVAPFMALAHRRAASP